MATFAEKFTGRLWGVLGWHDLDALWERMRGRDGWHVWMSGEPLPVAPVDAATFVRVVAELDALLRRDHDEKYCGIVYADDPAAPTLVKVYDPNNLGSMCHASAGGSEPRWVLSLDRPEAVARPEVVPAGRQRWWQKLFA